MSASENIPLLTDIIQLGDMDMKNHFDGHILDDKKNAIENLFTLSSENENGDDIPAIHLDTETCTEVEDLSIHPLEDTLHESPEIVDFAMDSRQDDSLNDNRNKDTATPQAHKANYNEGEEETEATTDTTNTPKPLNKNELTDMVNLLVSDAVDAILPIIEGQLKQSISEQIIQKLSRKLD